MEDESKVRYDEEIDEEEQSRAQRFSVVVVWSPGSDERLSPSDLQVAIENEVLELDEAATVEVTEVIEPTY